MLSISKLTHRHFILGSQGLWPGRRFRGLRGLDPAIRAMGGLQLDPLNIVARSQHIAMYGRVLDYRQEQLHKAAYEKRRFFDYGGSLFLYPLSELPYWRLHMRRRAHLGRWGTFRQEKQALIREVLQEVHDHAPLGNRDLEGGRVEGWNYRGSKETTLALYYLWITGEVMITHREGFDRYYDLRSRVIPPEWEYEVPEPEAEAYFADKVLRDAGLLRPTLFRAAWEGFIWRNINSEQAARRLARDGGSRYCRRSQTGGAAFPLGHADGEPARTGDAGVGAHPQDLEAARPHHRRGGRRSSRRWSLLPRAAGPKGCSISITSGKSISRSTSAAGGITRCRSSTEMISWHAWIPNSTAPRGRCRYWASGWKRMRPRMGLLRRRWAAGWRALRAWPARRRWM